MVRTIIIFLILSIGIVFSFSSTIAETNWTVLREDDFVREDGIKGMLHDVYFMDNQNGLVIGEGGLFLVTADSGKTWTKKEINTRPPGAGGGPPQGLRGGRSPTLYNIYFVNEKVGYITGARGTILKTEDGGKTWNRKIARSEAAGQNNNRRRGGIHANLMGIQMISETTGFIVGSENTILKTTDGGETWVGSSGRVRVGETRNNLESVWFVSPTTGWIIGSYGTLLHTTDGGETWEKQNAGFDNNLLDLHFFDEKTGWICGQEGLILHTADGGKTWKQQKTDSYDNLYDIIFVNKMIGWAVGDYSAVLHTTDGGKTWSVSKTGGGGGTLKGVYATDKDHCWIVDDWGVISAYKTK